MNLLIFVSSCFQPYGGRTTPKYEYFTSIQYRHEDSNVIFGNEHNLKSPLMLYCFNSTCRVTNYLKLGFVLETYLLLIYQGWKNIIVRLPCTVIGDGWATNIGKVTFPLASNEVVIYLLIYFLCLFLF